MHLYDNKRVTVAGVGEHGGAIGNIEWLHKQGAILTVTDLKTANELSESMNKLGGLSNITWVLGEHRLDDFVNADMILRNPAMPKQSKYLEAAREAKVPIEMDSSLFFKHSPARMTIGVTGSKGKTTTTLAIANLLRSAFTKVMAIGVEGTSPLAALEGLSKNDLVVFELSSWRLEAMEEHQLSPHTAVVTSLYRDHLNSYASFKEYIETKKAIIRFQKVDDRVLLNYDDERVRTWRDEAKSRVAWFSLGSHLPQEGICVRHGMIVAAIQQQIIPLMPLAILPFASDHERLNILPAIYLAFTNGIRKESIKLQARNLEQVAHRLELIGTIRGVSYINDSAATIPDATISALTALAGRPVVIILGGSDKQLQFEPLAQKLTHSHIKGIVFLPGSATAYIKNEIKGAFGIMPATHDASSMIEAVNVSTRMAESGDIVLLSPAATSFGLFKHEFDRGDQFKEAVLTMKE